MLKPETAPEMASLWDKLQPELDRIDALRYQQLAKSHRRQKWIAVSAIAASLFAAVFVLTIMRPSQEALPLVLQSGNASNVQSVESAALITNPAPEIDTADYRNFVNRAQVALLSLANVEPGNSDILPLAREHAGYMAQEAGLLNAGLNSSLTAGQLQLLNDIELLLLQYANLEDGDLASGMQVLQLFLNNNSLLFKLNLAEMREANPVI